VRKTYNITLRLQRLAKKKSNAAKAARLQEADAQVESERDVIDLIGSTMDPDSAKVLWVATTHSRMPTKVAMQRCLRLHKVSFNKSVARSKLVELVRQHSDSVQNTEE
jgi:hypothetical protein